MTKRIDQIEIAWLAGLPKGTQQAIRESIELRSVDAGTYLHRQGDPYNETASALWGLTSGVIRLEYLTDAYGHSAVSFLQPGAWFGAAEVVTGKGRLMSIMSAAPSNLASIPKRSIEKLLKEHPELWLSLAWIMARNVEAMLDRIGALMVRDSRTRLLRVLHSMSGTPVMLPLKAPIELHVTQEELSVAANLTSRTVRKILHDLRI